MASPRAKYEAGGRPRPGRHHRGGASGRPGTVLPASSGHSAPVRHAVNGCPPRPPARYEAFLAALPAEGRPPCSARTGRRWWKVICFKHSPSIEGNHPAATPHTPRRLLGHAPLGFQAPGRERAAGLGRPPRGAVKGCPSRQGRRAPGVRCGGGFTSKARMLRCSPGPGGFRLPHAPVASAARAGLGQGGCGLVNGGGGLAARARNRQKAFPGSHGGVL